MILTLPIFGAAFFLYGVVGWGRWAAIALLVLWLILALESARRQAKGDGAARVERPPQFRWQRAAKIALVLIPASFFIRAVWLDQSGAANDVVKYWTDSAMLVWLICFPLMSVVDWVASKLRPKA